MFCASQNWLTMHSKRTSSPAERRDHLSECVDRAMRQYFHDLDGHKISDLYRMFTAEVEKPFFKAVMRECRGNLSEATRLLGIHRSTLRERLKRYKIR